MHAAFSYDRRDPYARLPLESHVSSANDPSTTSITSVNNVNDHVSRKSFDTTSAKKSFLFFTIKYRFPVNYADPIL